MCSSSHSFVCVNKYVLLRNQHWTLHHGHTLIAYQGRVLLLRHDAVVRILADGSAPFFESCAAIGLKGLQQRRIAVVKQGPVADSCLTHWSLGNAAVILNW